MTCGFDDVTLCSMVIYSQLDRPKKKAQYKYPDPWLSDTRFLGDNLFLGMKLIF